MNKGLNNMANVEKLVIVDLGEYDNGFIAVSEDKDFKGLFVSNATYEGLVQDIPTAIGVLMKAIHDGQEFIVEEKDAPAKEQSSIRPLSSKKRFSARLAA